MVACYKVVTHPSCLDIMSCLSALCCMAAGTLQTQVHTTGQDKVCNLLQTPTPTAKWSSPYSNHHVHAGVLSWVNGPSTPRQWGHLLNLLCSLLHAVCQMNMKRHSQASSYTLGDVLLPTLLSAMSNMRDTANSCNMQLSQCSPTIPSLKKQCVTLTHSWSSL